MGAIIGLAIVAFVLYGVYRVLSWVEGKILGALLVTVALIAIAAWLHDGGPRAAHAAGATCTTTGVNLRECAGTSCAKIRLLPSGTEVAVQSSDDGWSEVSVDGDHGFVSTRYLDDC